MEFKELLLKYLYEKGYRYIARDQELDELSVFFDKPKKLSSAWYIESYQWSSLSAFNDLFIDVKWDDEEPFSIESYLGFIDWTKVPIDTKVLVRDSENHEWEPRHFAGFSRGLTEPFKAFDNGRTRWTNDGCPLIFWRYCKLAEEAE